MMSFYAEPGADGRSSPTDLGLSGLELVRRWGQDLRLKVANVVTAVRSAPFATPKDLHGLP